MRALPFILATTALLSSGCAALIARSGIELNSLGSKEEVCREFGPPVASGMIDGQPYEDYHTRRKIAEPLRAHCLALACIMTYGLLEVVNFPSEVLLVGRRTILGQDLRFIYTADGQVAAIQHDGTPVFELPRHTPAEAGNTDAAAK